MEQHHQHQGNTFISNSIIIFLLISVLISNILHVNIDIFSSRSEINDVELGGVWQYRQTVEEDLSLNGDAEEDDENTDFTDESALSTPLPADTDIGFFDPLKTPASLASADGQGGSNSGNNSNLWLLSSLKEAEDEDNDVLAITVGADQESIRFHVGGASEPEPKPAPATGIQTGKGDLMVSPLSASPATDQTAPSSTLSQNESPRRIAKNSSLLNLDLQDKGDYIVQAAKQISLAQHCEASNKFHLAFGYYKNGVGILLTGVQCK